MEDVGRLVESRLAPLQRLTIGVLLGQIKPDSPRTPRTVSQK